MAKNLEFLQCAFNCAMPLSGFKGRSGCLLMGMTPGVVLADITFGAFTSAPAAFCFAKPAGLRSKLLFILAVFLFFVLLALMLPSNAMAWGPGAHMVTGNWVLQNIYALPPQVAEALLRYPGQFLHGSLSPDIFIGKGSVQKSGHSHNWESGFDILAKANNLRRQAYAYGYLAHLAADTVAHNVYVPGTFRTAPGGGKLAHVYIETQADRYIKWDSADALGVLHEAGSKASERILKDALPHKAWKFWLKKHVYEYSIAIGGSKAWRVSMSALDKFFPKKQRLAMLDHMLTLSARAIVSLLADTTGSPVLTLDPIGAHALADANGDARRPSGKMLFMGGVKNIITRPLPLPPVLEWVKPSKTPDIEIIVPEALEAFPPVCRPGTFFRE